MRAGQNLKFATCRGSWGQRFCFTRCATGIHSWAMDWPPNLSIERFVTELSLPRLSVAISHKDRPLKIDSWCIVWSTSVTTGNCFQAKRRLILWLTRWIIINIVATKLNFSFRMSYIRSQADLSFSHKIGYYVCWNP